ncbi:hypothetical protein FACS1894130_10880 [Spirochaetia bacterium]|nr:hypothetical protein FACS1894130_10880 [Spirochaetia bacterium]
MAFRVNAGYADQSDLRVENTMMLGEETVILLNVRKLTQLLSRRLNSLKNDSNTVIFQNQM